MLTRLESLQSRFFLDPGKGLSRLPRIETDATAQQYARNQATAHRFTRPSHPRRRPIVQRHPTGGGSDSSARGPMAVAHPQSRSTVPSLRQFWAHYCRLRWSSAGDDGVPSSAGNSAGSGRWSPLPLRAGDPTPITQVKVHTRAKSRVSIETRELRLSSREYDFPGINISSCECILLAAISVSVNCCDSDGAGSGYQPMMGSSAQPPVVYGLNNSMQASCNALIATADGDLL